MIGTCRTCRFWFQPDKELDEGLCRRYPPSVFPFPVQDKVSNLSLAPGGMNRVSLRLQSFFPPVSGESGCGKWSLDEKIQKN